MLAAPPPEIVDETAVDLDSDLLEIEHMGIERFEDDSIHFEVVVPHSDSLELITDDVEGCEHHVDGESLSTLSDLGESYADLERDLIELSAVICDLPDTNVELRKYVFDDRVSFENLYCYDGYLRFTFGFVVSSIISCLYQDYEYEIGHRVGIPIDPSADELLHSQ